MTQLELNFYEFNTLLHSLKETMHEQKKLSFKEKPLSEKDVKSGIISWKDASDRTELLLEKLYEFTDELNKSNRKIVKIIQK